MSYLTIAPLMFPGNPTIFVDARTLFETYGVSGRFRDWVRRVLQPYMDATGNILVRYEPEDTSKKKKNYYFHGNLLSAVVDNCITNRNSTVSNTDSVEENVPTPTVTDRLANLIGLIDEAGPSPDPVPTPIRDVMSLLTEALNSLDRFLEAPSVAPSVGPMVPAQRAPEIVVGSSNSVTFKVRWHPYSTNLMYEVRGGATRRTKGYNSWCHKIDTLIPVRPTWFNPNCPVHFKMKFGHVKGFDVDNFVKSAIDAVQRKWSFNDIHVETVMVEREIVPEHYGEGSGLQNGYIEYTISQ